VTETLTQAGGPDDDVRPARRGPTGPLVALLACVLGVLGLVFGALPASAPGGEEATTAHGGVVAGSIRVFGAYVREPASPDVAAAYLSIANDGTQPDTLLSVSSGAADTVAVHDVPGQTPVPTPSQAPGARVGGGGADAGTSDMLATGPLTIPGGSTVTLAPTRGHLMLQGLDGTLRPGDQVNLLLTFKHAGQVLVSAPVVPIASPAPTAGGSR
jgi:hypothetical protein